MAYHIIQPPFTLKFQEMSKKDLKAYNAWFHAQIPERIAELTEAVQQTSGFETWQANCAPTSLDMLGEWFALQVEMRQRTQAEIDEIKSQSPFLIDIPVQELTNRTFSLAMDVGMYMSQVFLHGHGSLKWEQQFGSKKYIDYGQPTLVKFTSAPFNPVHMTVTLAYGLARKTRDGRGLRELYDIWFKMVVPS